jgi:UPF0271 protein
VIEKEDEAWDQLWQMVDKGQLTTISGTEIPIEADTFCIHSDTSNSEKILKHIHKKLADKNLEVE